jgi:HTH-type transcriptional regulator/antitoxin HipB
MPESYVAKTPAQLGEILRGFRKQRGLTQAQLASQLGLPQKAVSLAETHPQRLSTARLFQLLGVLGAELRLQDGDGPDTPTSEW